MPGSKPLWMDLIRGARKWWEPKIRAWLSQNPWSISILDVNVRTPLALGLTHAGVCKNPLRHVQTEFQTMYLSKCCLTSFHDWMSICEQILTRNVRTDFKNSFSCIIVLSQRSQLWQAFFYDCYHLLYDKWFIIDQSSLSKDPFL